MESFLQSFGNEFVSKNGQDDGSSLKSVQLVGIYFSAHWCPPCRNFTPLLADFYNNVNAEGKVFEIVFVSSDNNENTFKEYLSTMPWIAVKYGASEIETLGDTYQVSGIPRLVIARTDGTIVSDNGRTDIYNKGIGAWPAWLNFQPKVQIDSQLWEKLTTEGKEVKVKTHEHPLKFVDYTGKSSPGYSGGWSCNECSSYGSPQQKNWFCDPCTYDVCKKCFELDQ